MRKRFLIITLTVIFCVLTCGISVLATEKPVPDTLTDSLKEEVIQNGEWIENDDGSYSIILKKEANSLLRSNVIYNSSINYTLIPVTEEAKENLDNIYQIARSGGSKELTNTDIAGTVSAYSIINWSDKKENMREYVYLTSVSGGYSAEGSGSYISSGITVSSHTVKVGQSGFTADGYKSQYKDYDIGSSVRSYSYNVSGLGFLPVESTSGKSDMGTYYVITLKRGNSTWNCEISNNY